MPRFITSGLGATGRPDPPAKLVAEVKPGLGAAAFGVLFR
jgi:hypothetical protein